MHEGTNLQSIDSQSTGLTMSFVSIINRTPWTCFLACCCRWLIVVL